MSSLALSPAAVSRPAVNYWIVACVVVVPTFMEILDTTIANVALRYIAGGLSAAQNDSDWVITSYLAANAIVLPITGWLSAHLGRRKYFLLSIAIFTVASALCGMAALLGPIVGPTLGGWLCVNYDWRYIFLINVPIGIFSLIAGYWLIE